MAWYLHLAPGHLQRPYLWLLPVEIVYHVIIIPVINVSTIATLSFHHIHFEMRVLSVSHWMGLAVGVVIYILYILILIKSPFSCIIEYWRLELNAVERWVLDTGCFICVLTTETPRCGKPNCPTYQWGISGWLTCHNPSFCELGQVRKHMAMCCIEVVCLDHHLHQFTLIAHFYTVSHWRGIYLYFYLVKFDFLTIIDYYNQIWWKFKFWL